MNPANDRSNEQFVARVPGDIEKADKLAFGLTGRQLVILA